VLDYLFLDASMFRMHHGSRAEPVLAAWGITTAGKPVLVGLAPGGTESTDAWTGFLQELRDRGLRPPLLVISDGAGGLHNAAETVLGASLRQRCLIHVARNVLAKVGANAQAEIKAAFWAIFDTRELDHEPGQDLVTVVQKRIDAFEATYRLVYPAAVKCLLSDRHNLTTYLRFPTEHHHRIRHSNLIERTFGETRRRVKVIGRLPSESSCLSLVWAVLDRASRGWRGFTMTVEATRILQDLRRALLDPPTPLRLLSHQQRGGGRGRSPATTR
jgi:putative transposase